MLQLSSRGHLNIGTYPLSLQFRMGTANNDSCLGHAVRPPCIFGRMPLEGSMTKEQRRLNEARTKETAWKKWGPYLSERQWGTVREDYSEDGNAWNYFTHDQARSRA